MYVNNMETIIPLLTKFLIDDKPFQLQPIINLSVINKEINGFLANDSVWKYICKVVFNINPSDNYYDAYKHLHYKYKQLQRKCKALDGCTSVLPFGSKRSGYSYVNEYGSKYPVQVSEQTIDNAKYGDIIIASGIFVYGDNCLHRIMDKSGNWSISHFSYSINEFPICYWITIYEGKVHNFTLNIDMSPFFKQIRNNLTDNSSWFICDNIKYLVEVHCDPNKIEASTITTSINNWNEFELGTYPEVYRRIRLL